MARVRELLTPERAEFATHVANGHPPVAVFRKMRRDKKDMDLVASAAALQAKPVIMEAIRRSTWLAFPPAENMAAARAHALLVLAELSADSKSDEIRLRAALSLIQIADSTRAAAHPQATEREQDKVLAALRKLYGKIQIQADEARQQNPSLGSAPVPEEPAFDIKAIGEK